MISTLNSLTLETTAKRNCSISACQVSVSVIVMLAVPPALLFPINWPEPFGLVMIEAMASGTPVIAFRAGSVPEVIEDGVTGFIVDSEEEAVRAVGFVGKLNRREVRRTFEKRFTARRMADDYVDIYRQLTDRSVSTTKPIMSVTVSGETFANRKSVLDERRTVRSDISALPQKPTSIVAK
jgi:glycogen synthase